ncbi:MAG TPA: nucleotidyltransferase family protein [Nanoarchaeota archaeon]|nr:nucleotidyltransferase family protein [Candidatus Woesearchaeota archaeon]HIH15164.1 nucleotidyltransferase family protein [Nanoarchaeota archaeon]HIH59430.1 nucleotidyltransferase family protein [Nanoarchaeota archaeon]HII13828.1 nucleotidyltransferase family protein [Nanoarchaeota archaeon]HIJ04578.1 nucleotidyltransferase family protein [Nanoarchaeota archaeon]
MAEKNYSQELKKIILHEKWLMDILRSVRALNLPDWYLAAGVVRNTVWDVLHGYTKRTPLNDIDVVYYGLTKKIDGKDIERKLHRLYPQYTFEVVNQAFVHEMYHYKKRVQNSCEAIGKFIEIPTGVGVRLEQDDSLTLCAPHGLKDLFTFRVAPISRETAILTRYKERMKKKQWKKIWPKLVISSF